MQENLREKTN